MSKPVLGYWDLRGMTESLRYMLHYAGVDFEDKRYQIGPAPDYDRSQWLNEKFTLGLDFPNLPYLLDGDVKLTQSIAIGRYLARKYKLGAQTEQEHIRLDLAEQQCVDLRMGLARLAYNPDFEKLKVDYLANLPQQLELLSKFLGDRKFFAGDRVTYVDFQLYEGLDFHRILEPTILDNFENLKQFLARVEELPAIAKYMKSGKFHRLPINGPSAKFGGQKE